ANRTDRMTMARMTISSQGLDARRRTLVRPRSLIESSSGWRRQRARQGESNGQSGSQLVHRMTVRERVPQPDIEGKIFANLPDQPDEARHRIRLSPLSFIEYLGDRPYSPLRRPFDDHAGKEIGMMFARELCDSVQMDRPPVPAL